MGSSDMGCSFENAWREHMTSEYTDALAFAGPGSSGAGWLDSTCTCMSTVPPALKPNRCTTNHSLVVMLARFVKIGGWLVNGRASVAVHSGNAATAKATTPISTARRIVPCWRPQPLRPLSHTNEARLKLAKSVAMNLPGRAVSRELHDTMHAPTPVSASAHNEGYHGAVGRPPPRGILPTISSTDVSNEADS